MKLENQVVSLDLAKRLKELGVKQESLFYWVLDVNEGQDYYRLDQDKKNGSTINIWYPAFTVAELENELPNKIEYAPGKFAHLRMTRVHTLYESPEHYMPFELQRDDEIANSRAKMLIYLLENKLISIPIS